jgi:hypothetical protein
MLRKIVVGSCIIAGCWINDSKACTITDLSNYLLLNQKTHTISVKDCINMEEKGFPGIISSIKPKDGFNWGFLSGFDRYNWVNECQPESPAPVPEPSTSLLFCIGLITLGTFLRKRKIKK